MQIILSKDIDKYAFMSGSNFDETDVTSSYSNLIFKLQDSIRDFKIIQMDFQEVLGL